MSSRPRGPRPPWWPEGEAWPPPRRRGPRFLRFFVLFALVWLGLTAAIGTMAGEAAAHGSRAGFWIFAAAIFLLLFFAMGPGRRGFWGAGRRFRTLTEAARRLEQADSRRRTFLADLAHELRTPLAVIRAQAEAISEGVYRGDAEHLAPILDATTSLEGLVADLRTLAESDAGALELARAPVDVGDLLGEVEAGLRSQAEAGGVALGCRVAAGLPLIEADAARLRRALANLVGNALAHTPAGGSVELGAEAAGARVAITVTDTGAGMDPELAAHAFDRFVKGPDSRGSGLGLAIAKEIAEAHGGEISLTSSPGAGTSVRLTLPVDA